MKAKIPLSFLWFWIVCSPSYASDLIISPAFSLREVFSDNVERLSDGFEASSFITEISPTLTVNANSRRYDMALNYSFQNILYIDRSEQNSDSHLLDFDAKTTIIDGLFYFDTNVASSPRNTSSSGNVGQDNLSISGERSDVLSYELLPFIEKRIGNVADVLLEYRTDSIISDNNDSDAEEVRFKLSSGSYFSKLSWDLNFSDESIERESGQTTKFQEIALNFTYPITRKIAFIVKSGFENNDFSSSSSDNDGLRWQTGFSWNPSRRTSLSFSGGKRFFGTDIEFNLSHQGRNFRVKMDFEQQPDTTRSALLNQPVFNLTDAFDDPVVDVTNPGTADLDITVPTQSAEVIINRELRFVANYVLKKHNFEIEMSHRERNFELSQSEEITRDASISWAWNINRKVLSTFEVDWVNRERQEDEHTYKIEYRLSRTLTETFSVNAGVSYTERLSELNFNEYIEKRVYISLAKNF